MLSAEAHHTSDSGWIKPTFSARSSRHRDTQIRKTLSSLSAALCRLLA